MLIAGFAEMVVAEAAAAGNSGLGWPPIICCIIPGIPGGTMYGMCPIWAAIMGFIP